MSDETLFTDALAIAAPAERAAFLDRACAGDAELRRRIDALLAAHSSDDSFLNRPPGHDFALTADGPAGTATYDPTGTRSYALAESVGEAGQMIAGKYKLVEAIGEGGMGTVWMAQQTEPVKRAVAVKLIKEGMDSKAVLARFEAERQALAMMDHPNIAKILDGGLHDGRPYFVMELVKGVPITRFCDARKLTPNARLELFVQVCNAIQHAHQKGIIHRDIKPGNVLVALFDDRPVPKVIDFGIAKATGQALTDLTLMTGFGAVVGTPEYMSPEQASFNQMDVDTRSDVYALGVLLYELLTGTTPVDRKSLGKAALLEILRIVREVEAPRPSAKLSTSDALPSISANRGIEPKKLTGLMRNELDWIVMKALEKDRTRRYDTANGFAADVQRYLAGEAVQAHPPTLTYRMRKAYRKNRAAVLGAGLVALALCLGIAGTTWGLLRAERETGRVRDEQAKTKEALELAERNREDAELTLVRGWLRDISIKSRGIRNEDLNTELDRTVANALLSVSRQESDRVKLLFLKEGFRGGSAGRFGDLSERVLHAVAGFSPRRRLAVLELLGAIQRDTAADEASRAVACLLAIELDSDDLPAFEECLGYLARPAQTFDMQNTDRLARTAALHHGGGFAAVMKRLKVAKDSESLRLGAEWLAGMAKQLDRNEASAGFDRLIDAIVRTVDWNDREYLDDYIYKSTGRAIRELSARIDHGTVAEGVKRLCSALGTAPERRTLHLIGEVALQIAAASSDDHKGEYCVSYLEAYRKSDRKSDLWALLHAGVTGTTPAFQKLQESSWLSAAIITTKVASNCDRNREHAIESITALAPILDAENASRIFGAMLKWKLEENVFMVSSLMSGSLQAVALCANTPASRAEIVAAISTSFIEMAQSIRDKDGEINPWLSAIFGCLSPTEAWLRYSELLALAIEFDREKWLWSLLREHGSFSGRVDGLGAEIVARTTIRRLDAHRKPAIIACAILPLDAIADRLSPSTAHAVYSAYLRAVASTLTYAPTPHSLSRMIERVPVGDRASFADETYNLVTGRLALLTDIDISSSTIASALSEPRRQHHADHYLALLRNDSRLRSGALKILPSLLPTRDLEFVRRVAGIAMVGGHDAIVVRFVLSILSRDDSEAATAIVMKLLIDSLSDADFTSTYESHIWHSALERITDVPTILNLLLQANATGEFRTDLLNRLEVITDPIPAVTFLALAPTLLAAIPLCAFEMYYDDSAMKPRRFRSVYAAAIWAAERSGIDLDRPYHDPLLLK